MKFMEPKTCRSAKSNVEELQRGGEGMKTSLQVGYQLNGMDVLNYRLIAGLVGVKAIMSNDSADRMIQWIQLVEGDGGYVC